MGLDRYTPAISPSTHTNHAVAHVGALEALGRYEIESSARKRTLRGKVFLKDLLGLTGMEVSLTRIPAGESVPFLHRHHTHEELWIMTEGRGQMQVDGETFDVAEGTVVRVAPAGARTIRAAADSPLGFVCIQAREGSMPAEEAKRDGVRLDGGVTWPG